MNSNADARTDAAQWAGHERRSELRMRALEAGHSLLAAQLAEIAQSLEQINGRFVRDSDRMDTMQRELSENTAVTTDVRDVLDAGRSGLKVLGWLGQAAKWLGVLAASALSVWGLWAAIKSGGPKP